MTITDLQIDVGAQAAHEALYGETAEFTGAQHLINMQGVARAVFGAMVARAPNASGRTTHTYSTTNVVLLDGFIYAEDFGHETGQVDVPARVAAHIDAKHLRKFGAFAGESAMHHLTMWLHDVGAVVEKCWILGETLSDEERGG